MKKIALALAVFSATSCASASSTYVEAPVMESRAIYRTVEVSTPQRQCWDEQVARTEYYDRGGYKSRTPDLLGALVGGAIGNAVGHNKSNQQVGAVVGALIGGSVARDITNRRSRDAVTYYDNVERCEVINTYHQEDKLVGYDVVYRYNEQDYSLRMPRDPGSTVRLRVDVEPVF